MSEANDKRIGLVLCRCVDERIRIGDDIHITVVLIGDGKVRLGIDAPPGVPIIREELEDSDVN